MKKLSGRYRHPIRKKRTKADVRERTAERRAVREHHRKLSKEIVRAARAERKEKLAEANELHRATVEAAQTIQGGVRLSFEDRRALRRISEKDREAIFAEAEKIDGDAAVEAAIKTEEWGDFDPETALGKGVQTLEPQKGGFPI